MFNEHGRLLEWLNWWQLYSIPFEFNLHVVRSCTFCVISYEKLYKYFGLTLLWLHLYKPQLVFCVS